MKNFSKDLDDLKRKSRFRSLNLPCGIDLTSNDYLGLANHPHLRQAALDFLHNNDGSLGAGGSRLLRGHTDAHQALETMAAAFFVAPRSLYFSSGFQANAAVFQALPTRHDTVIFDEFVHASAREGIQNSHARRIKARHNDLLSFENALKEANASDREQIWIAIESVYSMDGDVAPLDELYKLAKVYDAMLIIDEAHGSGVMGDNGKGASEDLITAHGYDHIITLHTCGKAMGVAGGLLCGREDIIDTLINSARAFIYSTAPLPLQAYLVQKAIELIASDEGKTRRERLAAVCEQAHKLFGGVGTHIVPIVLGEDEYAARVANQLQEQGYDIRAIRPPTVPEGTARLRLSLNADMDEKLLDGFAASLEDARAQAL